MTAPRPGDAFHLDLDRTVIGVGPSFGQFGNAEAFFQRDVFHLCHSF
jgi:hypothetical protein